MTGSYLLHKNLQYNVLMTDLGLTPLSLARVRVRVCTRVLRFFAVTSVTDWCKLLKISLVCLLSSLF